MIPNQELFDDYWKDIAKKQSMPIHGELLLKCFRYTVKVKFEDGSLMKFNYANYLADKDYYLILTEHCGYHKVHKLGVKFKLKKMF